MVSSHLWSSELIGVHAEQVVHVAGGPLRKQLLHLGRKLMVMMIKMDMMIKMVMVIKIVMKIKMVMMIKMGMMIKIRIFMIQLLHLGRTLSVMMIILDARTLIMLITTVMTLFMIITMMVMIKIYLSAR